MKNKQTNCISCPNKNCFCKKCSPEWVEILNKRKTQIFYRKGQDIFVAGQMVLGLHFIQSGKVKVTSTGYNGREQIVRIATAGHILGHRGYGREIYPVNAAALEDSLICFVENDTIYEAFIRNPEMTYSLMIFYANELREVESRLKCQMQMNTREKVVSSLTYLNKVFGIHPKDKTINVQLSRKEIAELAGVSSDEQVVRIFNDLVKENIISKSGKKIKIIDETALLKIVEPFGMG